MAFRNWFGPLIAVGLVAVTAGGCSSGGAASPPVSDAGDAAAHRMLDSGIIINGDDSGPVGIDGTTGKACTSDTDCIGDAGVGVNQCSSDFLFPYTNVMVSLWASPVCIIPPPTAATTGGNCDPVPGGIDDGFPHFCDGPDDPSSPGLCLPFDASNPQPGDGVCYPLCTFALDGQKATGCVGTDTCFPYTFLRSISTSTVTGYGFCAGGCQQDSDCTKLGAGFVCQTDIGYCTQAKLARTKPIGAACQTTATTDDSTSGACNCDSDVNTGLGYCSSACVVGGLPCANGWVCDAGFQNPLLFTSSTGASIAVPVPSQNMGMPGVCRAPCTDPTDGGATDAGGLAEASAGDDGGGAGIVPTDGGSVSCPPNTTCQAANVVGPDCLP
jgi:hypothetical protein